MLHGATKAAVCGAGDIYVAHLQLVMGQQANYLLWMMQFRFHHQQQVCGGSCVLQCPITKATGQAGGCHWKRGFTVTGAMHAMHIPDLRSLLLVVPAAWTGSQYAWRRSWGGSTSSSTGGGGSGGSGGAAQEEWSTAVLRACWVQSYGTYFTQQERQPAVLPASAVQGCSTGTRGLQ